MPRAGLRVFSELLFAVLRLTGVAAVARLGTRGKAGILVYHKPSPATLDRHLSYLRRHASFISIDQLVAAIEHRDWSVISPRSLVVTFDDGHATNRALLDLFEAHDVRPTIFLCTKIVGTRRRFWWTAVDRTARPELARVTNRERLRRLHDDFGFTQTAESSIRQALSLDEITEMRHSVDFGAHTRFHPFLTRCDDDEAASEISGSHREVEELTGVRCQHFAFPNGAFGDREVSLVRKAGFASSRTTELGWNDVRSDRYRLKVIGVPDDASVNALAVQLGIASIPCLRKLIFVR
jgi:peptidoglycan/xylan/chitin deacetylase (PgdA/CDA1 family)